jgi:hypothetical protein
MTDARSPFGLSGEVESGRSGKYPKKLVDECILVFKDEDDVSLSEEEAGQILDSLGGLFLAFADASERKGAGGGDGLSRATARPFDLGGALGSDLISPHSCK